MFFPCWIFEHLDALWLFFVIYVENEIRQENIISTYLQLEIKSADAR